MSDNCSEPTNDNLKSVMRNDKIRYRRKGYGLITASLITFVFFWFTPDWILMVWPIITNWCSDEDPVWFKIKMAIICIWVAHNAFFVLGQLMHLFLYKTKIDFFERYKINPERAWPWEKDREAWMVQLKKSIKSVAISAGVLNLVMIFFDQFVLDDIKMRLDLESWPSKWTNIKQIVFFMVMEDLCFYWSHRLMHLPSLYPLIHKKHHEFKDTVSIASEYAHPLESILSNTLPTVAGYKLLAHNAHMVTVIMWIAVRVTETIDGHSGYEFSWSPYRLMPFSGSASFHHYHHTHNIGNYGSFFTFWDTVCGTSKTYWQYLSR